VDVWLPHQPDPKSSPRDTHPIMVLGKLASGRSVAAAQKEMEGIAADLERTYPSNEARGSFVEPLAEVVFGPVRPALALLFGAVTLVLIVACVNVANLLLARGAGRVHEVAIRSALGAGTRRLVRQFVIESLVLALIAGTAGAVIAYLALAALVALAPADVPRLSSVAIDLRVLGLTLALSVIVGLAFGLLPALQARRLDVAGSLAERGSARQSGGRRAGGRRSILVVAEVSLAVTLLAGAGLLIRSLWNVEGVDAGFRAGGVIKAEFQLPRSRYPVRFAEFPNFKEIHAFTDGVLRRAAALPGVEAVAVAGNHPLDPGFTNSFQIAGREAESRAFPEISVRRVTPGYFRTVGLAPVRGRLLEDRDGTSAPAVLVINQAAARRFFPGGNPLGAQIRFWGASRTIVGVVANERSHGLAAPAPIAVYAPLSQAPSANGAGVLLARTNGSPTGLADGIRRVIRDQDPQLAVFGVEPFDRTVNRSLAVRRFVAVLLALFAGVALLLAAVGIHGVLAYGVAQRRQEFGVRVALGARPGHVVRAVLRQAAGLVGGGLVLGIAGSLMLSRALAGQLFGVAATDPLTFASVLGLLGIGAVVAAAVPAWRASKVDPVIALRAQ
jgi:putative ABC transport system permease protein